MLVTEKLESVTEKESIMSAYKDALSRFGILAVLVASTVLMMNKPAQAESCISMCIATWEACTSHCGGIAPDEGCLQRCGTQLDACDAQCED